MKTIEISVVGEASIKNNKCLVDYTELKEYVAISHGLYEELSNLEYFLTQIDPVHFPDRKAARERIAAIRAVKAKARGES